MVTLQIRLLGKFQLLYEGQPVTALHQPRQQSLLAYLLLHRETNHDRRDIAFLFWPDVPERQAFANLRKGLHRLRSALPDADRFLRIDAKTIRWQPEAPFSLDVADFEETLAQAEAAQQAGHEVQAAQLLTAAVDLYAGDLLPNCYDDWLLPERERLRQQFIRTLAQLGDWQETERDYPAAIQIARRLLRHDPLHEATHRRLMQRHLLNGERAEALRVYHTCTTLLQQELQVGPSPATQEIYERILAKREPTIDRSVKSKQHLSRLPLVGRQRAWQKLLKAWQTALGKPQCVIIAGEAGIGKSRLAEELQGWATRQGFITAHSRAYEGGGRLAYGPVAEWLRSDDWQSGLTTLEPIWLTEIARLLPELLTQQPDLPQPQPVNQSWQRHRLFEALSRAVLQADSPLLLFLDDLQWCDQETLEWVGHLLRFDPQTPLLLVGTVRTEEIGPDHPLTPLWRDLRRVGLLTDIELGPLAVAETTALAEQIIEQPLDNSLVEPLYRETEGNPLFIVETVRAGAVSLDLPGERVAGADLPPRIQAVIDFRLDQLSPPARELVDVAAVIGQSFTVDVLLAAGSADSATLVNALDEAWQRRLIREQTHGQYDFSHGKIRAVAYAGLSPVRRRWLHHQVAEALEAVYQDNLDPVSSRLAHHFERADQVESAIGYYWQAAQAGRALGALTETVDLLKRGLALLDTLPDTPPRVQHKLNFLTMLASIITAQQGYMSPEANTLYKQALEQSKRAAQSLSTGLARFGILLYYVLRCEFDVAEGVGQQLIHQTEPALQKLGHSGLGYVYFDKGCMIDCRDHLIRAMSLPVDQKFSQVMDPTVPNLTYLFVALWYLGYPDQAFQKSQACLALAQTVTDPEQQAMAYLGMTWLYTICLEQPDLGRHYGQIGLTMSQEYGLHYWHGVFVLWQYGAILKQRPLSAAEMTTVEQQVNDLLASGAKSNFGWSLSLLAEAYYGRHDFEAALHPLAEAMTEIDRLGGHFLAAEIYRFKGVCLLALSDENQAQADHWFQKALTIARQQQAKSLELRAALDLARLWQQQGRLDQAHTLLAEVYGWFSEGFETHDLQAAQRLLAQLSSPRKT